MNSTLTPAEAILGFVAWLTTRQDAITFGATHDAAIAVELWKQFCETNSIPATVTEHWPNNPTHPSTPPRFTLPDHPIGEAVPSTPNQTDIADLHFPDN